MVQYFCGRFKRNINENVVGLDFIMKLRPVTYTWDIHALNNFMGVKKDKTDMSKAEKSVHTGFAQEVEKAAQETGFSFLIVSGIVPG